MVSKLEQIFVFPLLRIYSVGAVCCDSVSFPLFYSCEITAFFLFKIYLAFFHAIWMHIEPVIKCIWVVKVINNDYVWRIEHTPI